jgi:hypothetical protein
MEEEVGMGMVMVMGLGMVVVGWEIGSTSVCMQ